MKVLIWFVSNDTYYLEKALNILERQHGGLDIVGTATGEEIISFDCRACDVVLAGGARKVGMNKIVSAARQLNVPEEKLLGDWLTCVPCFTLDKYRKLQRSRLSIFSVNCLGGMLLNTLGLPFLSPFINLYLDGEEFIRFLRAPRVYMEEQLTRQEKTAVDKPPDFPVATLGNISLNMMHYKTFEESVVAWNRRKARINWYNLLVIMQTEREEILREFDALPYGKKVCFVPFKSDLDSAWYVNPDIDKTTDIFARKLHHLAHGEIFYYELFDMLLYGKKTPLIEM